MNFTKYKERGEECVSIPVITWHAVCQEGTDRVMDLAIITKSLSLSRRDIPTGFTLSLTSHVIENVSKLCERNTIV